MKAKSQPQRVKEMGKQMEQNSFETRLAVLAWLKENGWQVSRSALYNHCKQGRLRPDRDGLFSFATVKQYASTFLRRSSTGQKVQVELDRLQRERAQAETKRAVAQAEHWELKNKVASGAYILYCEYERDLAGRITILKSDAENFARSSAGEIIRCVNGDPAKTPDLIDMLLISVRSWLVRYSSDREFVVPAPRTEVGDNS